ncbi:hypothetical protein [Citreimonas salinaria]|uniref:Uncharacterized protein n=1 Tax=Citreimonas salinaria TaxID=321339 RepID=A0A1H3M036_9RHOB|nr:hypothetical protein [Citreimonas salinaria]SDY69943.1 hypothetical protein SAMN05444340_11525 [Citreimonas salinaria]
MHSQQLFETPDYYVTAGNLVDARIGVGDLTGDMFDVADVYAAAATIHAPIQEAVKIGGDLFSSAAKERLQDLTHDLINARYLGMVAQEIERLDILTLHTITELQAALRQDDFYAHQIVDTDFSGFLFWLCYDGAGTFRRKQEIYRGVVAHREFFETHVLPAPPTRRAAAIYELMRGSCSTSRFYQEIAAYHDEASSELYELLQQTLGQDQAVA